MQCVYVHRDFPCQLCVARTLTCDLKLLGPKTEPERDILFEDSNSIVPCVPSSTDSGSFTQSEMKYLSRCLERTTRFASASGLLIALGLLEDRVITPKTWLGCHSPAVRIAFGALSFLLPSSRYAFSITKARWESSKLSRRSNCLSIKDDHTPI